MSDSAAKNDNEPPARDLVGADIEKRPARVARCTQRPAPSNESPRVGETLDLFAEDAERANQQALNTDIRQGTFEGFELPEVFMAAVQSKHGISGDAKRQPQPAPSEPGNVAQLFASEDDAEPSPRSQAASFIANDRLCVIPERSRALDAPAHG